MDDGRIGQSERRTVIQFTIWPSIYLGDIISSIALSLSLSLSLPLSEPSPSPQRGKWDFLTKTHHRRRRCLRLRERPINVGGIDGGDGIKRTVGILIASIALSEATFAGAKL